MKKEEADKLVAALRSGEYKQGKLFLGFENTFCCLGVYCEISGIEKRNNPVDAVSYGKVGESQTAYLPDSLVDRGGFYNAQGNFRDHKGVTIGPQTFHSLVGMNDAGISFEMIAEVIEQRWEEL